MKLKLCFSALCAAAVILLASPAAYADSYDLSLGSISIDSTASGQTVVQNGKTAVDPAPVITQKSAEATQNTLMSGRVPGIEKSAGGWLRRELGQRLQLRYTPELVFTLDDSLKYGAHMFDLLEKLERQEAAREAEKANDEG